MRITAGKFRGRKLKTPRGLTTRPVLARIREALFTVLGDVTGMRVLDLFAGTGALGIESVSRGAASLVSVEQGYNQCRIIRENCAALGFDVVVMRLDVRRAMGKLGRSGQQFDLIFADPPYKNEIVGETIVSVCKEDLLAAHGFLIVTAFHAEEIPREVDSYKMVFDRCYGDTRLAIYQEGDPG